MPYVGKFFWVCFLPSSACEKSALGLYLRFTHTEFIALLNCGTAGDPGRALWFVLLFSPDGDYSELRLFPWTMGSRRRPVTLQPWGISASNAEHASKPGRLQASGVARDGGQHGSGAVSLLVKEERRLAIHTVEINIAIKL